MPDPQVRAGDTDREALATVLGEHMSAGRLTLAEYEERLARAYAARTFGDLAELTADLPDPPAPVAAEAPAPSPFPAVPAAPPLPALPHQHLQSSWRAWLSTSVIVLAVYLLVSVSNGEFDHFWPMWVIGPWGAVLLARRIRGEPGSDDSG